MRSLIFGVALLALATIGSSVFISAALSAARDAKAATISDRFAPPTKVLSTNWARILWAEAPSSALEP